MEGSWTARRPGSLGTVARGVRARFSTGASVVAVLDLPEDCTSVPCPGSTIVLERGSRRLLLRCLWTMERESGPRCVCLA